MPGPSNAKKKRKAQAKKKKEKEKEKRAKAVEVPSVVVEETASRAEEEEAEGASVRREALQEVKMDYERYRPLRSQPLRYASRPTKASAHPSLQIGGRAPRHGPRDDTYPVEPTPRSAFSSFSSSSRAPSPEPEFHADARGPLPAAPCVEDRGNGPHVHDIHAFLSSKLCSPPSLSDALCAEFAREEVLQMLCGVLPAETALIVWHNKSRRTARICPACRRLYRIGELTREPLLDDSSPPASCSPSSSPADGTTAESEQSRRRRREQEISGICSALCFMLVAYRFPAAIRSTWGRMAEELSDETWDELDGPLPGGAADSLGFSMMLKMTRCHDLGLSQLFGVEEDGEGSEDIGEEDADECHRA
ncbi:uncharacterized protein PHACADRAFT_211590 [Phanerochaete carnosa HHB-10118-sp]|uniref:Uncharacterized protein n=1 Tax=Phanerochaete carnosa (strain HHB-10118-sp) TaxID=650164 RepID=K5VLP7_PHACS|nr:uncharacterized protein PHACADRAFT_211590 [Phanerochaete carnosa HHB-10118-sp]EKM52318.1 hypothetical protein PHACADRAFT_211590 [Phanerochaete carnosa HHB-10118-sp]